MKGLTRICKYGVIYMTMEKVVAIWKKIGQTPLETIIEFREKNEEYRVEKISYAGRLDPMAEGVLLLLVGEENKKREKYEGLKKSYEVEILFGLETDTYDKLGMVREIDTQVIREEVERSLQSFVGKINQKFPPYSSKPVNGKPLYWWAREGRLGEIEIPSHEVEIFAISSLGWKKVRAKDLAEQAIKDVLLVQGDFRQEAIINSWKKIGEEDKAYDVVNLSIECSGGTYMRQLAHDLGEEAGSGAMCLSIKRISVGDFS